ASSLGEPDLGVDPVEGGGRDDQVKGGTAGPEVLEGDDLEGDCPATQPAPGGGDHRRTDVDRGEVEAVGNQLLGQLTGATAHLQHRTAPSQRRGGDHELDDLVRIGTPG